MGELVASELRHRILSGELSPGESLSTESVLAEEYDVSRPTLREALRILESQQLISVRRGSHKGPVVTLPDPEISARTFAMLLHLREATPADIYQFRMLFEPPAAGMAAERATEQDIADLRLVVEEEAKEAAVPSRFTEVAWGFHTHVVRLSGNRTMSLVCEVLERISQRHAREVSETANNGVTQNRRSVKSHARLIELIEAGDRVNAERHWRRHMEAAGEVLLRQTSPMSILELLD
jgi:GntR family transcriptional repressor for pyruvate dehydrogenase complex